MAVRLAATITILSEAITSPKNLSAKKVAPEPTPNLRLRQRQLPNTMVGCDTFGSFICTVLPALTGIFALQSDKKCVVAGCNTKATALPLRKLHLY